MKLGVVQCGTINLNERKLRDETGKEFVDFMEDLNIKHLDEFDRKDLFKKFVDLDDEGKIRNKDLTRMKPRTFAIFLKMWVEYRDEMAGYKTRKSNGAEKWMFFHDRPALKENLEGAILIAEKSKHCTPIEAGAVSDASTDIPF